MIRVLLVDDEPIFHTSSRFFLEKDDEIQCETADSASEAIARMDETAFDVIVSDYDMPVVNGIELLKHVHEAFPDMPFILLTGRGREEVVIEALNIGADFYLQKGTEPVILYTELLHKIRRAVERKRSKEALKKSEERFRTLFTSMNEAVSLCEIICDEEDTPCDIRILEANPAWEKETGLSRNKYIGKRFREVIPDIEPLWIETYGRVALTGEPACFESYNHSTKGFYEVFAFSPSRGKFATIFHNITKRKQTENELLDLKKQLETEIRDLNILHSLSVRYLEGDDVNAILREILEAAIAITGADKGNLHLLDPATGMLKIAAHKHFDLPFMEFFEYVDAREACPCGAALERMERVIVEDISQSPVFNQETREVLLEEGIHAVQSTPLVSRGGYLLGILSTHFCNVHTPEERELQLIDILARQAADMIERKRTEDALKKSEEKFRLSVQHSPTTFFQMDCDLRYTWMFNLHPAFSIEDLLGKTDPELFPPEDAAVLTAIKRRVLETGIGAREVVKATINGIPFYYDQTIEPLRNEKGTIIGVQCASHDITAQKLVEADLKESREQYRALVQSSPYGIAIHSEGIVQFCNQAALEIFGVQDQEEVIGRPVLGFVHPQDRDFVVQRIQQLSDGDLHNVPALAETFIRQDGSPIEVEVTAVPVTFEGRPAIHVVFNDITERKKAEKALKESEEKYRQFFEQDLTADLVSTPEGRIITCNPAFIEVFGFNSIEEAQNTNIIEMYPSPDDRKETLDLLKKERELSNYRVIRKRRDGSLITVVENVVGQFDENGELTEILSYLYDDSERTAAENALKEANAKLNLLTSITRHDILNQVTALKAFLVLIEENYLADPESWEMFTQVQLIADTIRRQITFTGDYQYMGEQEPEWQNVEWILKRAAEGILLNGTRLKVDTGPLEIFADPMLEKVFYNILDNTIAHGKGATEINVRFSEHANGGTIVFEDDGTGVPADMKEKIFDRGVGTITGYGLFLAKEILGITGMSIRETGEEGRGARFEISVQKDRCRFSPSDM